MENQTFISTRTIRSKTTIDNSIIDNLLNKLIIESQELYLVDILGVNLYEEIETELKNENLTKLNTTLLTEYIRNFLVYSVKYSLFSESSVKVTTKGIIIPTSTDFETPEDGMIEFQIKSVKNKLDIYKARLLSYLNNEKDQYPLFKEYIEPKEDEYTEDDFMIQTLYSVGNPNRIW